MRVLKIGFLMALLPLTAFAQMLGAPLISTSAGGMVSATYINTTTLSATTLAGNALLQSAVTSACLAASTSASPVSAFIVFSTGKTSSCATACAASYGGYSGSSCLLGWTIFSTGRHFQYGTECTTADPTSGQSIQGKYCCCKQSGYAMDISY